MYSTVSNINTGLYACEMIIQQAISEFQKCKTNQAFDVKMRGFLLKIKNLFSHRSLRTFSHFKTEMAYCPHYTTEKHFNTRNCHMYESIKTAELLIKMQAVHPCMGTCMMFECRFCFNMHDQPLSHCPYHTLFSHKKICISTVFNTQEKL